MLCAKADTTGAPKASPIKALKANDNPHIVPKYLSPNNLAVMSGNADNHEAIPNPKKRDKRITKPNWN